MATYLDKILDYHRQRAANDVRSLITLLNDCSTLEPTRSLRGALVATDGVSIIAEIKRRSPSKGVLSADLSVPVQLDLYHRGGASAVSVLTDSEHFGGSLDDLKLASQVTSLPLLRKDFTVSRLDVVDARLNGADAILLIAAGLTEEEIVDLADLAHQIDLEVILEIHSAKELATVQAARIDVVGINQRDLRSFAVDLDRAVELVGEVPKGVVSLAESGVSAVEQINKLRDAGFDGALVGESLVRSEDPEGLLRSFVEAGRR